MMTQDPQSGQPSASQTAKEQAAGVAHGAVESGHRLVDQAKEQAGDVGRVAGRQAKDVLHQGRSELTEQAAAQQRKVAGGLRSFSAELGSMAESSDQSGLASDLARQVATRVDSAAGWLDDREPGALLEEVKTFARNRPGTFLAVAAAAGLLAGRLTRGLKDASGSTEGAGSTAGRTGDATGAAPAHRAPGAPSTGAATAVGATTGHVWSDAGAGGTTAGGVTEDVPGVPQRTSAYAAPGGAPTTHGSAEDTMAYGTAGAAGTYTDPAAQAASGGYGTAAPDPGSTGTYGTGTYGTGTDAYEAATGTPGAAGGVDPLDRSQEFDPEQRPTWAPVEDEGEQR